MTQQQKVIELFEKLLVQGTTTTLDVKLALRQKYVLESWNQDLVSKICVDYQETNPNVEFKDNGFYREYYLISTPVSIVSPAKLYLYKTNTGATITTDDPDRLVEIANQLGEAVHYSRTKDKVISIKDMQENHLLNTIFKLTNELNPKEFANFVQTSPYIKELITRYPI